VFNFIVSQTKRTRVIKSIMKREKSGKFCQFTTEPQKIAQIPAPINEEPTGSVVSNL